jgi:hypothetical protein
MNLSVQAVFSLKLMPCAHVVSSENARSFAKATSILKNIVDAKCKPLDTFQSANVQKDSAADVPLFLCTWRPRFCLDIMLYFSKDGAVILALPMYGQENAEIQYYTTETLVCVDLHSVYFFGHLTCDIQENGSPVMVILLYDMMTDNTTDPVPVQARYDKLQSLHETLNEISIGDSCVRVQWAGHVDVSHKICELSLPHDAANIIFFGHDHVYHKFPMLVSGKSTSL